MSRKFKQSLEEWCIENNLTNILNDFDSNRNNVTPDDVNVQNNIDFYWFICGNCGERYYAKLYSVFVNHDNRCPNCAMKRKSPQRNPRKESYDMMENIKKNNQEYLLDEWQTDKNGSIEDYGYSSPEEKWWKCRDCGYEWKTKIFVRTAQKCRCPRCVGKVASESNNLKKLFMRYGLWKAYEWWDEEANGCKIEEALPGKRNGHFWRCPECGNRFNKKINTSSNCSSLLLECNVCGCTHENGTHIHGKFHPENGLSIIEPIKKNNVENDKELLAKYSKHLREILTEDEYFVVEHSIPIGDAEEYNQSDLSKMLGISKDKMLSTRFRAMRKIRQDLLDTIGEKDKYSTFDDFCNKLLYQNIKPFGSQKLVPIFKTELPQKIQKTLKSNNIYTLNQLLLLSEEEILEIRHIGQKELEKIMKTINEYSDDLTVKNCDYEWLLDEYIKNSETNKIAKMLLGEKLDYDLKRIVKNKEQQDTDFLEMLEIFNNILDE